MTDPISADSLFIAMADPKPWWQSTSILGGAAVLLSQVVNLIGYQLDADTSLEIITSLMGIAGAVAAIYGRIHAVQPIRR